MPKYDHIHVRNIGEASLEFKTTDTGRNPPRIERGDRAERGSRLQADLKQLRAVFAQTAERQAETGVPERKRGGVVAIEGAPGRALELGPRQLERKDVSVLGVRRRVNQAKEGFDARVFVTERGMEKLITQAEKYTTWENTGSRRPNNFWLFDGVETFRAATVEDFWNDDPRRLQQAIKDAEWEVWTRRSLDRALRAAIDNLDLEQLGKPTAFEDLMVYNLAATRAQIARLIEDSTAVVELRGASNFIARDHELPAAERQARVKDLGSRLSPSVPSAPMVTLLDTGVNRSHPLLRASLPASRCHSAEPKWDKFDADGHGTKMAGVALFGDLAKVLAGTGPVPLKVQLESVTVAAPQSPLRLPARDALARAVDIVEAEPGRRVFCLAATAIGEPEKGLPTSTSATLDKLAFGDGIMTRLFCTAVGNVDTGPGKPYRIAHYAQRNEDHPIQSPAQAMNALSVGASTQMCSVANLVSPAGDLSPTSRTAHGWELDRPHKPDIVMEGGNQLIDAAGKISIPHAPDMLMTTGRDFANSPLTVTGETSAATAAASRLAALVMQRYPAMRAETVRGLIVNSARWTDAMKARLRHLSQTRPLSSAVQNVLSCYGWGIPDEDRLFESAGNALTLIVEDTLRPYEIGASKAIRLREMKYFRLPWPDQALEALGGTEVEVRCTLSYFAEPDPGSVSRDEPGRYQGHKLKFDFKRHGETDEQAQRRFNSTLEVDAGDGDESGWLLGRRKSRGTLHQDVWTGPAYQLLERNGISVAPNHGWWSASGKSPEDKEVHFSLIVSLSTPAVTADLYTETLARVPAGKLAARTGVIV